MNQELPEVQARFTKVRGTRDQLTNICWIIETSRELQKNIFSFTEYAKDFDYVDHNKLWEILQEKEIPEHLTCLLRNLYAGQEAIVSMGHGTIDWFQIGKGVHKGCILSPCLFIYIQNASYKMPDWMNHQLESRLLGEISTTSHMQMPSL